MLSGTHFYYRILRNNVIAFGSLFKDLVVSKYANDGVHNELSRMTVPLTYAGKEDFWVRSIGQPDLPPEAQFKLPAMAFAITSIAYDPSRKLQTTLQNFSSSTTNQNGVNVQYNGVPYNIGFQLSIFVRNIEDGLQIVEQIFPWFTPDYTLTMNFVEEMGITKNIPIILNNVQWENDYEGAAKDKLRRIVWTLDFTMQTYFYGPVVGGGLITQANVNFINYDTSNTADQPVQLFLANTGLGVFQSGEYVYQGSSLSQANAVGTMVNFIDTGTANGVLTLDMVEGTFVANMNVRGAVTAASWNVYAVPNTYNFVTIEVTPVPANSNGSSDFGFLTQIIESA